MKKDYTHMYGGRSIEYRGYDLVRAQPHQFWIILQNGHRATGLGIESSFTNPSMAKEHIDLFIDTKDNINENN
jgi:hypothetical protein